MGDRTQTLTVEIDRDQASSLANAGVTLTEPQAFAWGQALDHIRRQCRNALSQPEHQGALASRLLDIAGGLEDQADELDDRSIEEQNIGVLSLRDDAADVARAAELLASRCSGEKACPQCNPAPTKVEEWPALVVARDPLGRLDVAAVPGDENAARDLAMYERTEGFDLCRYLPATSQDSSGLEEKAVDLAEKAADLVVARTAERDAYGDSLSRLGEEFKQEKDRAERAETALEEIAEELERQATDEDARRIPHLIADTRREDAQLVREKAAQLKEGER